ncbi:Uncharacterised protein [uncultured archaeon]|nr:Uncharacterised protein [uncultured archaeon]
MQRLWDKARESRPSIYEPTRNPFAKAPVRRMDFQDFSGFFQCYIEEKNPSRPDICELHRHLAIASDGFKSPFDFPVYFERRGSTFNFVFPNTLAAWGLLAGKHRDPVSSAMYFVKKRMEEGRHDALPYGPTGKRTGCGLFVESLARHADCDANELRRDFCSQSDKCGKTISSGEEKPCLKFKSERPAQGIESEGDTGISQSLIESIGQRLLNSYSFNQFDYPFFPVRLLAVLGHDETDSYWVFKSKYHNIIVANPLAQPDGPGETMCNIRADSSSMVAIGAYPWDADHLQKAKELSARGILTAKPLGRLFAGEIELALFSWVPGIPVRDAGTDAWIAYGEVMRKCHERGVFLNDAAGRNAMWDGKITLIDYEHTYFSEEIRPLSEDERYHSLARIAIDVEDFDNKRKAFEKGYGEKLPAVEEEDE